MSSTTSAAPSPAQPPAQAPPTGEVFGINVNLLFDTSAYSSAQISAKLQAVRATGATLARSDAFWELSEPSPPVGATHIYDWSFDDRVARALAEHGLTWLPIIDYSAVWNRAVPGQWHSPPASDADYAAFAAALASRYGPGGAFWAEHPGLTPEPVSALEIWNEPDSGLFWAPAPNPAAYADLYLAARAAILTADPSARVIVGGLTQPTATLPAMLAARPQLAGHVDGVAVHPYATPLAILGQIRADRRTLVSLGQAQVPLYVTEFGWVTHPAGAPNYVPEARRATYIRTTLTAFGHLDCGLAGALLYTWVTPELSRVNREDWFGIQPPRGGPAPAVRAFTEGLRRARAPGPRLPLCGTG